MSSQAWDPNAVQGAVQTGGVVIPASAILKVVVNPWTWVVAGSVVLLIIILILIAVCRSGKKEDDSSTNGTDDGGSSYMAVPGVPAPALISEPYDPYQRSQLPNPRGLSGYTQLHNTADVLDDALRT